MGETRQFSIQSPVNVFVSDGLISPCLAPIAPRLRPSLYSVRMSIRKAGGDWEPMLLGIEPRSCKVCGKGLYRNVTLFRGGWSRCTRCDQFVHYSCLASGKSGVLKARPRVCKICCGNVKPGAPSEAVKPAVGS